MWNKNIAQCFADADADGSDAETVAKRILEWSLAEAGSDDTTLFVIHSVNAEENSGKTTEE